MYNSWISVPESSTLEYISRWAQLGNNLYAGLRHLLLVFEQNPIVKNGPLIEQVQWPINAEFTYNHRKKNLIKYTAGINESITSTITQQLSTEVISKVNTNLNAGKILAATLSSELQEKENSQLTESLSQGLSITKTFEIQEETEISQTLKFVVPKGEQKGDTRMVNIFNKVKEIRWDVYLYQSDYLQLEYEKNWIWKDVRKTIITDIAQLKLPLFSIIFYEPIPSPSYSFDEFETDITNITEIKIEQLDKLCPNRILPKIDSLEQLAKLAFPVTKKEKAEVKKRDEYDKIVKRSSRIKFKTAEISNSLKKAPIKISMNATTKSASMKASAKKASLKTTTKSSSIKSSSIKKNPKKTLKNPTLKTTSRKK